MSEEKKSAWKLELLEPFGVVINATREGEHVGEIRAHLFEEWVELGGVVLARGFAPLDADGLPEFGRRFGQVLEWDFGEVNELRVHAGAKNYLYTNSEVPFHWDGAFIGRVPRYIIFQCESAPPAGTGGETLFCDTRRVLERAAPDVRDSWSRIAITYSTEKVVHYGGTFTSPLLATHPVRGEAVLWSGGSLRHLSSDSDGRAGPRAVGAPLMAHGPLAALRPRRHRAGARHRVLRPADSFEGTRARAARLPLAHHLRRPDALRRSAPGRLPAPGLAYAGGVLRHPPNGRHPHQHRGGLPGRPRGERPSAQASSPRGCAPGSRWRSRSRSPGHADCWQLSPCSSGNVRRAGFGWPPCCPPRARAFMFRAVSGV